MKRQWNPAIFEGSLKNKRLERLEEIKKEN